MKKCASFCLALFAHLLAFPQTITINNPKYNARTSPLNTITKVELTDTSTNLYFKVNFTPGWYIVINETSCIQPSNGDQKLYMKSVHGMPVKLNEKWVMPSSGEVTYSMSYPKIDPTVEKIDFLNTGEGGSWHIFDIEIKPRNKPSALPENLMDNWFKTDGSNQWAAGFFDNIAIYNNDFWEYSNIQPNGNNYEIVLKKNDESKKLLIVTGKKGICSIGENKMQLMECSKKETFNKKYKAPDEEPFSLPIIRNGTAIYKGYIHGYSPKLGFKTGLMYVNNIFTANQNTYTIDIAPNGTFETKIPLPYPTDVYVRIASVSKQVFLEPGKSLLHFIDLKSPDGEKHQRNSLFMGYGAGINTALQATDSINYFYTEIQKLTPMWVKIKRKGNEFSSYYSTTGSSWEQIGNNITIPMASSAYVGLCVTSHNNKVLCKADFSEVILTKETQDPSSWKNEDIGRTSTSGNYKFNNGTFTVSGAGADIWGKADAFQYVYQPLAGDGEIIAKVNSYTKTDGFLKVGVMIRESLTPGAKYAMTAVCPGHNALSQYRLGTDSLSKHANVYVKKILDMSPEQYKAFVLGIKKMEDNSLAEYQKEHILNRKALQIIRQTIDIRMAMHLTEYNMNREYAYREVKKVPREQREIPLKYATFDTAYFDTIRTPLNSPFSLLSSDYYYLINRVKYSEAAQTKTKKTILFSDITDWLEKDSVIFTAEEKECLEFYKEYTKETPEKRDTIKSKIMLEKYKPIMTEINKKYASKFQRAIDQLSGKNDRLKNVWNFFGCSDLVMDIMKAQDFSNTLKAAFTPFTNEEINNLKKEIKDTSVAGILLEENNKLIARIAGNKLKTGYVVNETPKTESEKLFDDMLKKFRGKVVYVDFWATWCGPCRHGIQTIAPLKEEMKNDSVVFVYITGETSPLPAWKNAIPDIKGEHFRVSADEWDILCRKFNVSGIPHYVLVNKKGEVVNPKVGHLDNESLKRLLKKHLGE